MFESQDDVHFMTDIRLNEKVFFICQKNLSVTYKDFTGMESCLVSHLCRPLEIFWATLKNLKHTEKSNPYVRSFRLHGLPIVAACSGSKVSSVNLNSKL